MRLISDFALGVATVWAESRGEPYAGQIAVGEVIRNRAKVRGSSIAAVVLRPQAFSCWNTYDVNRILAASIDDTDLMVKQCADAWLASETSNLTNGATNYWNPAISSPSWAKLIVDPIQIGHHVFGNADVAASGSVL